jgi:N-acetyl-gamma-glutamyl-phosphate reductase
MQYIKVGIVGGAGYTAGELLRILVNHPSAQVAWVHSKSNAGNFLHALHTDLIGETQLKFTDTFNFENVDLVFLCLGHGDTQSFITEQAASFPKHLKIIDLSQDFRWGANTEATAQGWVYGLTELQETAIRSATRVANPGCFATAIQLALLPLAASGNLSGDVHIHATTGSTGAGQRPTDSTHFSWRNNNVSVYEVFKHRHLKEISASLAALQPEFSGELNFIPARGNFTRGIFATVYTYSELSETALQTLYADFYQNAIFTHVTTENPHLKQVVNSNKALVHVQKHKNKVLIISMIDNLLKGASGQAVENMNLMFGLPQDTGLRLKASAF